MITTGVGFGCFASCYCRPWLIIDCCFQSSKLKTTHREMDQKSQDFQVLSFLLDVADDPPFRHPQRIHLSKGGTAKR